MTMDGKHGHGCPLIKGGQGRSSCEIVSNAMFVAWIFLIGVFATIGYEIYCRWNDVQEVLK